MEDLTIQIAKMSLKYLIKLFEAIFQIVTKIDSIELDLKLTFPDSWIFITRRESIPQTIIIYLNLRKYNHIKKEVVIAIKRYWKKYLTHLDGED